MFNSRALLLSPDWTTSVNGNDQRAPGPQGAGLPGINIIKTFFLLH